jgi:hypothetical protein
LKPALGWEGGWWVLFERLHLNRKGWAWWSKYVIPAILGKVSTRMMILVQANPE